LDSDAARISSAAFTISTNDIPKDFTYFLRLVLEDLHALAVGALSWVVRCSAQYSWGSLPMAIRAAES
jgi:hypothetical protein